MMRRKGPRPDRNARRRLGCEVVELDDLSATCDIRVKPVTGV